VPRRNLEAESATRSTDDEAYIPAGTYTLGPYDFCRTLNTETGKLEGPGPSCEKGYLPAKEVTLKAYFLDRAEVSLEEYDRCARARACPRISFNMLMHQKPSGCANPDSIRRRIQSGAVNCVTHHEAEAYCEWKHKRLPTDAEWEVAARGGDTRMFTWGDDFPLNEADTFKKFCRDGKPCDVHEFGPYGPFRLYGMESGVREWTSSPACESYPQDCKPEQFGVKGGMYSDSEPSNWDVFSVGGEEVDTRWTAIGFRCARDADDK
jgi:formylglycine-generating enzyme required for sulfatase activity